MQPIGRFGIAGANSTEASGFTRSCYPRPENVHLEEGFKGARWPKCIGPDGREWPHVIHSLLIWQQPHPIFFAELDYRAHPE